VVITDTLPPSVTLVSVSPAQYITGPVTSTLPNGSVQLTWYSDTMPMPPGWTGQIAVIVHVHDDVPRGTLLANQIAITYTGEYSPSTTADDTDVVTVEVASDLEGSQKLVDNPTPNAGESIQYTIVVSNVNLTSTIRFTVSDRLPPGLLGYQSHDPPSTGAIVVDHDTILWTGEVISNSEASLTFQATVTEAAYIGQVIRNTAYVTGVHVAGGEIGLVRSCDVTVARGVFGNSGKTASPGEVASGNLLTYTVTARNNGSASHVVTVTDSLPPSVTLVLNSFSPPAEASNVTLSGDNRAFTWTTSVGPGVKNLSWRVTVADGLDEGVVVENTAYLDDGFSPDPIPLTATVTIDNPTLIYLPIMLRN